LTEDSSGKLLLEHIVPRILASFGEAVTWRIIPYRGIGRIPAGLKVGNDPSARFLLDQLPRLLRGYANTPGIDVVVVVLDSDNRNCKTFLEELIALANSCGVAHRTMFRLAIEELEAWYLGDRASLVRAFPKAKARALSNYKQDSVCGTWELLAEAIHPGGIRAVRKAGWPLPGAIKHEWADRIGPHMDVDVNQSPSFIKFREGIRRLCTPALPTT